MSHNQGIPWAQRTIVGGSVPTYRVQPGQSLRDVTDAVHGPGASVAAMVAANPQVNLDGPLPSGTRLLVPPAARGGPLPPGGPSGNGVGGGSFSQGPVIATRARGPNVTNSYAVPAGNGLKSTLSKDQTKAVEKQKASGR